MNALDGTVAGGDDSSWLGQANPSNTMLDSDNNQMENLGPLKYSTSGDRGSGFFPTPAKIGLWQEFGVLGRTFA